MESSTQISLSIAVSLVIGVGGLLIIDSFTRRPADDLVKMIEAKTEAEYNCAKQGGEYIKNDFGRFIGCDYTKKNTFK